MPYFTDIYQADLSHREKAVYQYLKDRANSGGNCWPGVRTIMKDLNLSRRTVQGGALGVDMWAGEILLQLKEKPEYNEIQLMIALPFEGHDEGWIEHNRRRMAFLIRHSTQTVTVGQKDAPPAVNYRRRNEYMVDRADCLLAVYDNDRSIRSGTGMTVRIAEKKGLPITLIHPDTGVVSQIG